MDDDPFGQFRGSVDKKFLGSRGLALVASNPGCQRLRALSVVGIPPDVAASEIYHYPSEPTLSPFAKEAGEAFERAVLGDRADWLLQAFRSAGLNIAAPAKVLFVDRVSGGRGTASQWPSRLQLTDELIASRAAGDPAAPDLIVKPRFKVRLLGSLHEIEPDALVAEARSDSYLEAAPIGRVMACGEAASPSGSASTLGGRGVRR